MTLLVFAMQLLVLMFTPSPQGPPGGGRDSASMDDSPRRVVSAAVDPSTVACTFENPKFAGQCVENVTPDENQSPVQACNVVLSCLNNPRCVKVYCNATTLRAGWTLVSATPVDQATVQ